MASASRRSRSSRSSVTTLASVILAGRPVRGPSAASSRPLLRKRGKGLHPHAGALILLRGGGVPQRSPGVFGPIQHLSNSAGEGLERVGLLEEGQIAAPHAVF